MSLSKVALIINGGHAAMSSEDVRRMCVWRHQMMSHARPPHVQRTSARRHTTSKWDVPPT